jgi:hypothetical protein
MVQGVPVVGATDGLCDNGFANDRGSGSDRDYNDFVIRVSAARTTVVPEPSTASLIVAGVALLVLTNRRRRRV